MKKYLGITFGGLQKKTVTLVLLILAATVAIFLGISAYQSRMLSDIVGQTRSEQQTAISQASRDTMHQVMENTLVRSTALQAKIADNDFSEIVDQIHMLQAMAQGLFENKSSIVPASVSLPDPEMSGIPSAMVLGLHYAPFAYILIGGIFRNMDANLEEAATILDTPRWKTMFRITLPMIKPAILSTILLVFGSAMGSYPVPHYLNFETLSTKYISLNSKYTGEASILAIIMMVFGVAILLANQLTLKSRKSYTTVTGKSGQISRFNLGKSGKYVIGAILIVITFFTSIYPIISFAFETFLPNPGDYSFLYTGNVANLTTKWWVTAENVTENGMYGQQGMLYNKTIWHAYGGTMLVSVACALTAGTIGTLIGYAVSKNRRSKWANYVNNMAFLPYLMPSIAVGVAFFILFSNKYVNLFNTYWLLIIAGTVKYIPFASRASLNSMLQLSGEIEEAAIIQDIPWFKRMFRIIVPIQKSSIISGFMLPFMTCLRELSLFMLLCTQGYILSTTLDYFDEMGLYAFSSGINLILIVTILIFNTIVNKLTGASLDEGIGG